MLRERAVSHGSTPREGKDRTGLVLAVTLLLVAGPALLLPPLASADPGHEHGEPHGDGGSGTPGTGAPPRNDGGGGIIAPPDQGTAPRPGSGPSYLSWYQNAWIYGSHEVTILGNQYIRQLDGDGDWLTWIDGRRNDVYAYNIPAGDGFYVTEDSAQQYKPQVDGNVIVWEDRRNGPSHVYAYFLETGETRRVSKGGGDPANHVTPRIDYPFIAWSTDSGDDWDVIVHDLQTGAEIVVSDEGARDVDPLVVGSVVYWRTYRFNVWDVQWFDMATGERGSVTSDRVIEAQPFSNGENALFLKQSEGGWTLNRFDRLVERTHKTTLRFSDPTLPTADGDHVVQARFEASGAGVFAHNYTNGHSAPVSGYLPMTDSPVLMDGVLYAPVWNGSRNAILAIQISDFAWKPAPRLLIANPDEGDTLRGPTRVNGRLTFADGWGEPQAFGYSVNGVNFTRVPASPQWSFILDLQFARPGSYEVSVEAHFKDAPPVVETVTVIVPMKSRGIDVEQQGKAYQFALMAYYWERYVGQNPVVVALFALAVVVIGLWIMRWRWSTRAVKKAGVEYVPPDDDDDDDDAAHASPPLAGAGPDRLADRLEPERYRTPWSDG